MKVKTLNRAEAASSMGEWMQNLKIDKLDKEYQKIRGVIVEKNSKIRKLYNNDDARNKYNWDLELGLFLYSYLNGNDWFTERLAENDGFWRYLSIKVVPDVVGERWGNENEDHYWKKASRNWLKVMWWYIHLSWQGNEYRTRQILSSNRMNTDIILNLVERVGRDGTYVEAYRYIMYFYYAESDRQVLKYSNVLKNSKRSLFRSIMILHNSKCMVIEPGLYLGGEEGYVQNLFNEVLESSIGEKYETA